MNKIKVSLAMVLIGTMLQGMEFKAADKINLDGVFTDDLAALGGEISVKGEIGGNLFLMGGEIDFQGEARNSVYLFGGELVLGGLSWKNTYLFGGDVVVIGKVHGDLNIFAGSITVDKDAEIYGMVRIRAGDVILDGQIEGPVNVKAGNVILRGVINNDVSIDGKNIIRESGSLITGKYTADELDDDRTFRDMNRHHRRGFSLAFFISSLLIGLLWHRLFPETLARSGVLIQAKTVSMTLWGMLYVIAIPIVAVILMVGLVTIPVSVLLLAIYAFSIFLGQFPLALLIGNLIGRNSEAFSKNYLPLVTGMIILYIALKIPVLNAFIIGFWIISGFGSVCFAIVNERKQRRSHTPGISANSEKTEQNKG